MINTTFDVELNAFSPLLADPVVQLFLKAAGATLTSLALLQKLFEVFISIDWLAFLSNIFALFVN